MIRKSLGVLTLLAAGAAVGIWATDIPATALAQVTIDTVATSTAEPEPVETDIHEYMEYVNQPTFQGLKLEMAQAPTDDAGWTAIKSGALILAESGNLLLFRGPEENRETWVKNATAVRQAGSEFYNAAKEKDFQTARKHYETMIANCNQCHNDFAHGEHQLTP